jgi:hypothetical protein
LSRAKTDTRNALVRRFLLLDLAKMKLSGRQWDVLAVIMDDTYGWQKPGQPDHRVRLDRNRFKMHTVALKADIPYKSACRALRELLAMNIVCEYSAPTKTEMGIYGINSDASTWVKASNSDDSSSKTRTNIRPQKRGRISDIRPQECGRIGTNTRTNVAEKPHNGAGLPMANIERNIEPNTGEGVLGVNFDTQISTVAEAVNADPMDRFAALNHAERNYFRRFGQSLSPAERSDLGDYFELSEHKNSLLAIWLEMLPSAFDERQAMRRDPERARYAKGSPYKLTRRMAGDRFAELKAKKSS